MSGTCSRKYPVAARPFTFTPNTRKTPPQRKPAEPQPPVSRAILAPLITIVPFSASSVSRAATCRSVLPAIFPEGLTRTAIRCVLTQTTARRLRPFHLQLTIQLLKTLCQFLHLDALCCKRRFQSSNDLFRRAASKGLIVELLFLRANGLAQAFQFLRDFGPLRSGIHRFCIFDAQVKFRARAHRTAALCQPASSNLQVRQYSQPHNSIAIRFYRRARHFICHRKFRGLLLFGVQLHFRPNVAHRRYDFL